jgi:peptide-methionine (S)-S-oxide reductase
MTRRPITTLPRLWLVLTAAALWLTLSSSMNAQSSAPSPGAPAQKNLELATFGGGCFWCIEAIFQRIDGVKTVVSGYSGGAVDNPTYKQVCNGDTGHAEVLQIGFDPQKLSFEKLLDVFWLAHDPTTLNRQGADVGTQYRSVIFYHSEAQKAAAEKSKKAAQSQFKDPIVTEISALKKFYKAEDYHQNYFNQNPNASYCAFVIRPKLKKVLDQLSKKPDGPAIVK